LKPEIQKELNIQNSITKPIKLANLLDALQQAFVREISAPALAPGLDGNGLKNRVNHHRVLLVEDNPDNQKLTAKIMQKNGYQVDIVDNGVAAVEAVWGYRYDCIMMDIQMPVMDGFQATAAIRDFESSHDLPRVPIVALTAHALQGYREKCLKHGMDDYLTKPLQKTLLLNTLNKWIDPRPTVLLADDSSDNRKLVATFMKKLPGFRLTTATNGLEALEVFKTRPIAMVLMDVEMPAMNGIEATQAIRQLDTGKDVPIIAFTAHRQGKETQACLDAGCNTFISKPIRQKNLLELIGSYAIVTSAGLDGLTASRPPRQHDATKQYQPETARSG
jgi:CheY-like chemotaxis protein